MKILRIRYIILFLAVMLSQTALSDDFTLKGKVIDEEENALELVSVACLAQGKVTMTNLKGEFSIDLQSADSVEVRFSMVGYAMRKRVFRRPKGKMTVQIVMHPMEALQEITVNATMVSCREMVEVSAAMPSSRKKMAANRLPIGMLLKTLGSTT